MHHSSRKSLSIAFTLGLGTGMLVNVFFKKASPILEGNEEFLKPLKYNFHYFKTLSLNLFANPIPDLYKATDSLTLSEEDLVHATA